MKIYFTLIIICLLAMQAGSQSQVWNTEIHEENIQIRLPKSTVVGKLDVDIPESGKVLVRFDGYIKSTPGDRIIVAASNYDGWVTNDGNLGLYTYDTTYNVQSFSHERVYDVINGNQSFYAVAHNFVDTDGNGIASIHGNLTVTFYPDTAEGENFRGTGILKYPLVLTENTEVVNKETFVTPSKGKILVQFTSSVYSLSDNEIEIAISDSETWPSDNNTDKVNIVNSYATRYINASKLFDVEAGEHSFFVLARKIHGNMTTSNNAFYANMTIEFFPDRDDVKLPVADYISFASIKQSVPVTSLNRILFDAPGPGKVILQATGKYLSDLQGTLLLAISDEANAGLGNPDLKLQKLHSNHGEEHFSVTKVMNVEKGANEFFLAGGYAENTLPLQDGTIAGNFILKYIAEAQISSTNEDLSLQPKFTVFPNPTPDRITIRSNIGTSIEPLPMYVYNLKGNLLKTIKSREGQDIDLSDMNAGMYIIQIQSDGQTFTHKIVKTN